MSEDKATQTAVEKTDVQPAAGTEVATDARKDGDTMDTLLKAYDQETKPAPAITTPAEKPGAATTTTPTQPDNGVAEVRQYIFRQDMDKLVASVRGDLDPEVFDNDTVEAWVDAQARKDPRLQRAWIDRLQNPAQFERIKTELGKSFVRKFSKMPDKQATEDREAVSAAVRGASTRTPEDKPANYGSMSRAEVKADIEKKYGYSPNF